MATEKIKIKVTAQDKASKTLGSVQKKILAIGAAYLGWRTIKGLITGIVEAGLNYEKQWNDVAASLKRHNYEVETTLDLIQQESDAMQTLTGVSDELIGKGIQRLMDANFSLDDAMKTVMTSLDLSVGLQMDFRMVNELVAKSIDSSMNALTRYGIQIDKSKSRASQVAELGAAVEKAFGGAAAARMDTAAGKIALVEQKWGDLYEKIYALGGPVFTGALDTATEAIDKMLKAMDSKEVKELATIVKAIAVVYFPALAKSGAFVATSIATSFGNMKQIFEDIQGLLTTPFSQMEQMAAHMQISVVDIYQKYFESMADHVAKAVTDAANMTAESLQFPVDMIKDIQEKLDELSRGSAAANDAIVNAAKSGAAEIIDINQNLLAIELSRFDAIVKRAEMSEEQLATFHAMMLVQLGMMNAKAAADWLIIEKQKLKDLEAITQLSNDLRFELMTDLDRQIAEIDERAVERKEQLAEIENLTALDRNVIRLEIEQSAAQERLEVYEAEAEQQVDIFEQLNEQMESIFKGFTHSAIEELVRFDKISTETWTRLGWNIAHALIDVALQAIWKVITGIGKEIAANTALLASVNALTVAYTALAIAKTAAGMGGFSFFGVFNIKPMHDNPVMDALAVKDGRDYGKYFMAGMNQSFQSTGVSADNLIRNRLAASQPAGSIVVVKQYFTGNVMTEDFIRNHVIPATEEAAEIGRSKLALEPELETGDLDGLSH